jgi:hypothetical protein
MITLEQVDKLREKANVSYDEARAALEAAGGDMLEALINLERQGKVIPPEGGGYYNSNENKSDSKRRFIEINPNDNGGKAHREHGHFKELLRRFFKFCAMVIHKGNINSIEVIKNGEVKTAFSVTVLVVLAFCFFWITIPLLVIGLFLGYSYRFRGPDLGKDCVNSAMNTASNAAEALKNAVVEQQKPQP